MYPFNAFVNREIKSFGLFNTTSGLFVDGSLLNLNQLFFNMNINFDIILCSVITT